MSKTQSENKVTIYVIAHWESKGIFPLTCEMNGNAAYHGHGFSQVVFHKDDYRLTFEEAKLEVEKRLSRRVASTEKKLARLRRHEVVLRDPPAWAKKNEGGK
jgi:hypothetical protein